MKRTLYVIGSFLWLLFSLLFLFITLQYLGLGAGLQFFGSFSSASVLLGVAHVAGFVAGAVVCFAVAAGLWVRGTTAR